MSFLVVLVCALINGEPACSLPIQTFRSEAMTNSACADEMALAIRRVQDATVKGVAYEVSCKRAEVNA